jgi:hypothetical protein
MEQFWYRDKKVDSKYFEVKIYNHKALHLIYENLMSKFGIIKVG